MLHIRNRNIKILDILLQAPYVNGKTSCWLSVQYAVFLHRKHHNNINHFKIIFLNQLQLLLLSTFKRPNSLELGQLELLEIGGSKFGIVLLAGRCPNNSVKVPNCKSRRPDATVKTKTLAQQTTETFVNMWPSHDAHENDIKVTSFTEAGQRPLFPALINKLQTKDYNKLTLWNYFTLLVPNGWALYE